MLGNIKARKLRNIVGTKTKSVLERWLYILKEIRRKEIYYKFDAVLLPQATYKQLLKSKLCFPKRSEQVCKPHKKLSLNSHSNIQIKQNQWTIVANRSGK